MERVNLCSVFMENRQFGVENMFFIGDSQAEATTALGHLAAAFKLPP